MGYSSQKSDFKRLLLESCLATGLVFFVMFLLFVVFPVTIKPLNYLAQSIKEIQLTDIYHGELKDPFVDTNIVLVNVGTLDRAEIAQLVKVLGAVGPAAIGLDI